MMSRGIYLKYLNNLLRCIDNYAVVSVDEDTSENDIFRIISDIDDLAFLNRYLDGDMQFFRSYNFLDESLVDTHIERIKNSDKSEELKNQIISNCGSLLDEGYMIDMNKQTEFDSFHSINEELMSNIGSLFPVEEDDNDAWEEDEDIWNEEDSSNEEQSEDFDMSEEDEEEELDYSVYGDNDEFDMSEDEDNGDNDLEGEEEEDTWGTSVDETNEDEFDMTDEDEDSVDEEEEVWGNSEEVNDDFDMSEEDEEVTNVVDFEDIIQEEDIEDDFDMSEDDEELEFNMYNDEDLETVEDDFDMSEEDEFGSDETLEDYTIEEDNLHSKKNSGDSNISSNVQVDKPKTQEDKLADIIVKASNILWKIPGSIKSSTKTVYKGMKVENEESLDD
ncbi:hypothetical protein D3C81_10650 [compost metagenome]